MNEPIIENANSSGQGYCHDAINCWSDKILLQHGFVYSHTTRIHSRYGAYAKHYYAHTYKYADWNISQTVAFDGSTWIDSVWLTSSRGGSRTQYTVIRSDLVRYLKRKIRELRKLTEKS